MKKLIILLYMITATFTSFAQEKAGKKDTTQHPTFYSYACPMHPNFVSKKAGKCPQCGMDLTQLSPKERLKRDVTKTYTCPVHVDVISTKPGRCPVCDKKLNLSPKEKMKAEVVGLYTCPMHPDQASDKPGKCSKCGMKLVQKESRKQ